MQIQESFHIQHKTLCIKKTWKSLNGNTVNNFPTDFILGSWIWWCRYKSFKHRNKLTDHLLVFNQVTSL